MAGTISYTSGGKGLAANVAATAGLQTAATFRWCQKVHGIRALASNATSAVMSIDQDGAGTAVKAVIGWINDGAGNVELKLHCPGVGDTFGAAIAVTGGLPVDGNYIICEIDITNFTQHVTVYKADGTTVVSDQLRSSNFGTNVFSVTGTSGRVTMNLDTSGAQFDQHAQVYSGAAIYNVITRSVAAPTAGDSGITEGWFMNDATSGTSPSTMAAIIGGAGLVNTAGTYLNDSGPWAPVQVPTTASVSPTTATISAIQQTTLVGTIYDANSTPISSEPVDWSSDNTGVATVDSSGVVSGVAAGTANIKVADHANSAVNAIAVITITASPPPTATLTATAYATGDSSQPLPGLLASWSSADPNTAFVDGQGNVTGIAAGGPITITANINGKTATCAVTVV